MLALVGILKHLSPMLDCLGSMLGHVGPMLACYESLEACRRSVEGLLVILMHRRGALCTHKRSVGRKVWGTPKTRGPRGGREELFVVWVPKSTRG